MTEPDLPDSGMASGTDAGRPGEHLGGGDLRPDEQQLLAELERGAEAPPAGSDAELRAAEDDAPLPAEGGAQDDGLEADFSDRP
ncbi:MULTISPECIES: hypothetical protein [unclassified Geodermatophilus]